MVFSLNPKMISYFAIHHQILGHLNNPPLIISDNLVTILTQITDLTILTQITDLTILNRF
jgi:hypothetical protein